MALACGTRAWKMTPGNYTSLWKIDGKDATWAQLRWTLMGLEVAGGVFSEWAQSAGWRVGLSVFVWQCSGDALFLKHQERQTYTQQEHKSRDWKFWACLQTLTSSLESKLKAPWAQPRNSWGGGCYPKLHRGALQKWSRSYHHHLVLMTYNTFTPNLKISKTNRITGILFTVVVQCCLFKLGLLAVGRLQPDLVKGAEGGPITLPGASAWRDTVSPEHFWYQLGTEFHSGDVQPGSVGESARFSFPSYMLETRLPSKAVCCLVTYLSAVNLWLQVIHPQNQGKDREIEYIQFI